MKVIWEEEDIRQRWVLKPTNTGDRYCLITSNTKTQFWMLVHASLEKTLCEGDKINIVAYLNEYNFMPENF